MDTFLEVVLHDVHFSDDTLKSYELICEFAVKAAGGNKVGSEVAIEADLVMLNFRLEPRFLFTEERPFEEVFGESVVFCWIFDKFLGGLGVLLAEMI